MNRLAQYLLNVVGACMIAAVARRILAGSKQFSGLGNVIIGIFLIFSILSPVKNIDWNMETWLPLAQVTDFSHVAAQADDYREAAIRSRIKQQSEAYVWNKAQSLSMDVQIEITLAGEAPYAPVAITLTGPASPYARGQLTRFLANEMGIPKEAQTWKTGTS